MGDSVKIALGLSGGVDSAVAAALLLERGFEVVGVTMTLGRADEESSLAAAREAAARLGIGLHVFDLSREWRAGVLDYLRSTYLAGRTPNPCVRCNETVKFGLLPRFAFERLGCTHFATGHYARLAAENGGVRLFRGTDRAKDQSYFLYRVPQAVLARTVFPLGALTKAEVRERARALGLAAADRGDSQDFCGGDPMAVVAEGDRVGNIVTAEGKVLGRHRGFWHYTVGKRKGLGIGGGIPYFVTALRPETNEVVVGYREAAVTRAFEVGDFVAFPKWGSCQEGLGVKVRSGGEPHGPCRVEPTQGGVRVTCPDGILGVAPGQSAVFYDGDEIVGGGVISAWG